MKTGWKIATTVLVVAVVVIGAIVALRVVRASRDGIHYLTRPAGYADITASVSETGTVNPVDVVAVGSEVSGTIEDLDADFNSRVVAGQILATLDATTYQAAVDSASANLELAKAGLQTARVGVDKAKAQLDLANLTLGRDQKLVKQGLLAQSQLDTDQLQAQNAQQDCVAAQVSVQVAGAQVSVADAQLQQARFNLSRTVIKSPISGIVLARSVSVGQTVAASLQTPTLFTLASNLTDMQVDTSVDEADIGSVKAGQTAEITVTAYPNVVFPGTVSQVRVNPTVVQNVVTYDAVVSVHDASGRLMPGMTAQVTIEVGKRLHVLSVPTAAVLFRPAASGEGGGAFGGAALFLGGGRGGVAQPSAGPPVAGAPGSHIVVWVLKGDRPTAVPIVIGLSDGRNIEVAGGELRPGDPLIVAQERGTRARTGETNRSGVPAGGAERRGANGNGSGAPAGRAAGGEGARPGTGAGAVGAPQPAP